MTTEKCDPDSFKSREDAFSPHQKRTESIPFRRSTRSTGSSFTPTPRVDPTARGESSDPTQMRKRRTRIGERKDRTHSFGQTKRRDFWSNPEDNNRPSNSYSDHYDRNPRSSSYGSYGRNNDRGRKRAEMKRFENEYDEHRAMNQHRPQENGRSRFNDERHGSSHYNRKPTPTYNNRKKSHNTPLEPIKYREVLADPNEPIRLNKFLSNAGICSRREADILIEKGEITVNGEVVTELGKRVTRQDEVIYKEKKVEIESKIYVLLNKPKNCVTTSDDPECRTTVMDMVRNACQERIYPVGRLDRNTTGVLLITNDGDLASKLTHPSFKKKKIYHVWLNKNVSIEDMQKIADGIVLEDGEIHADAISYVSEEDTTQVGIEIHSGRNRIVRRIFEYLGYRVIKLDRVYFAGLTKKNLPRGKWRYLNEQEVNNLRMGAFE